jgi:hypothetical protein
MRDPARFSFKPLFIALFVGLALMAGYFLLRDNFGGTHAIKTFEDCVNAGNPVLESYPEQCTAGGQTFVNTTQLSQ